MATTQFQGVDQGGNPVTITVTDDPAEGGGSTLSDIVSALNGTLTVDDGGNFNASVTSLPTPVPVDATGQGDVPVTGSIGVASLPSNLITNGALDVNAISGFAAVEIQGADSTGTTQTLGFVDGEDIAKVADTSSITAAENGIQIFGEDSGGNPVLISTNDAGEVHIREVPSQSDRALSLGASTTTIASADAELTGIWVGSSTEFVYLKIYEGTGNTVGNDAPALTLPVPAESGGTMDISPRSFTGGIEVAATLSEGDNATDAPTGVVTANVFYR